MTLLHIKVEGKTATYLRRDGAIVCDNDDYRIAFIFDDEWASYTEKTARFICKGEHYDVKFVGSEVAVPALPDTTEVTVGLYVPDAIRTTTSAVIPCLPSVLSRGTRPSEAYAEPYVEPILAAAHRVEVAEENAAAHASGAAASAESAANAATTAEGHATDAARSAQAANRSAGAAQTAAGEAIAAATAAESEVVVLTKRVVNLEKGITPDPTHVDDTLACRKAVPANALPYAQIDVIGGMTYKKNQLFDLLMLDGETGSYDRILLVDGEGIHINKECQLMYGTPEERTSKTLQQFCFGIEVGKVYTLSWRAEPEGDGTTMTYLRPEGNVLSTTPTSVTFEATAGTLTSGLYVRGSATDYYGDIYADATQFTEIMLNEGASALPWQPFVYGPPIRDTKVMGLIIGGANLWAPITSENGATKNGVTLTIDERGVCTLNGTCTAGAIFTEQFMLAAGTYTMRDFAEGTFPTHADARTQLYSGATGERLDIGNYDAADRTVTFTVANMTTFNRRIKVSAGHTYNNCKLSPMLVKGSTTPATFVPYHANGYFGIPAEVQAIDGYGWGLSGSVYNGIEWDENGKATFVKRVGRVTFDGTEAWWDNTNVHGYFVCATAPGVKPTSIALSNRYLTGMPLEVGVPCIYFSNTTLVIFPGTDATTIDGWKAKLAEWKAAGNPLTLYYELAEPVVTDVSAYLSSDNFVAVEGCGEITAHNANSDAVPTTVIYQLKPEA